jgi:hypothetical protein
MTAARQEGKSRLPAAAIAAILGLLAAAFGSMTLPRAATTELVVANRHTGLAIDGFDPVAYFVDGKPTLGRAEFELRFAGAAWRFRNPGNRAAFAADPEIYMPYFGGHDPIAIARGAATPGHPALWAIVEQKLYLFFDAQSRAAFMANPGQAIEAAERHWPEVLRTVAP